MGRPASARSSGHAPAAAAAFTVCEAGDEPPAAAAATPILFTHTLCPYAERVWLALLEKGVPFHLCHVDLSSKPAWFRRINSSGLVPALQHGGRVHTESADICRWLDGALEGPPLSPLSPADRQQMDALLRGPCSRAISAGLDLLAGRGRSWGIGSGQSASQRAAMDAALAELAAAIAATGGPFLLGPAPTLADINCYPFIKRYSVAAPLTGYDVAAAGGGAVGRWLAAMDGRPSAATTAADPALLLQAFKTHQSLDFFDYETYSVFELHPHNRHLLP